jgi:hypothetical protein
MDEVRRNLELDHIVAKILAQRQANRRIVGQDHDPLMLRRQPQLFLGADHPLRLDATDDRRLKRLVLQLLDIRIDQPRARQCQRHPLPLGDVRRARHNRQPMLTGNDRRQHEPVGVRVPLDLLDLGNVDPIPLLSEPCNPLGLQPGQRQAPPNLFGTEIGRRQFLQPLHRYQHG